MIPRARQERMTPDNIASALRVAGMHVRLSIRGEPLSIFATVLQPLAGGVAFVEAWGVRSALRVEVDRVVSADVVTSMSFMVGQRIAKEQRARFARKEEADAAAEAE